MFRRPLHGHVHIWAHHYCWIEHRRCRSVTLAQSVWVCLVAFSSQYSCFLFVYFVNLLVWTHAPFMHSAEHPKVGQEGNFCSHPMHPSYTLPNTIRASYGSCFVEYCSIVLSVRCRPSSVNIDLTVHSRPDSQKSGTMLLHYCSCS